MKIQSDKARKILAAHLEEHAPDVLQFAKLVSARFGKLEEIDFEYGDQHLDADLLRQLKEGTK